MDEDSKKDAGAQPAEAPHVPLAASASQSLITVPVSSPLLVAPRDGRLQYRVANIGEVLPAGGRVFTMLDVAYVYMDIYLPTRAAGQVKLGSEARIVLDALPNVAIPAAVTFIATRARSSRPRPLRPKMSATS